MPKTEAMLQLQEKFRELSEMLDIYANMRYDEGFKAGFDAGHKGGYELGKEDGLGLARQMLIEAIQKPLGIVPVDERGPQTELPDITGSN
jgi:flagellar biosynthesis/type III secretory pathway protein FliH